MKVAMIVLPLVLFFLSPANGADCQWDKDVDYPSTYAPLVMDTATWTSVLPHLDGAARVVTVAEGAALVIACPQTTIDVLLAEVVNATCVGGKILNINGQDYEMVDLGCTARPHEDLRKNISNCGDGGELHAIGFDVVGYEFYDLMMVCFDPVLESNLYTTHTVRGAYTEGKDSNPDRPSFKSDGFYTVSANTCYLQESQIALMEDILGDSSVIDVSQSLYFARGHMAPDADFVTEQEQDATYYYINAAPQWQAFNNGNWKQLEFDTRDLAASLGRDVVVWTGAWNVLQLDDVNNNPVDIFLGLTENEAVLPAPDITWKVVYDEASNEGAAIVGVNNPYLTEFPTSVCADGGLCSSLSWLNVNTDDLGAGATYCCTVQDLAANIPNAPDLGSAGLLTG